MPTWASSSGGRSSQAESGRRSPLPGVWFATPTSLVLDEPSAALDVEAEYGLHLKFREIMRGRMCVPVSHRLATVRMADRIVVLEDGRIKEQGTRGPDGPGRNLRPASTASKRTGTTSRCLRSSGFGWRLVALWVSS